MTRVDRVYRLALGIGVALVLTGCESEAEKELASAERYAETSKAACQDALSNIKMVETARDIGGKPSKYRDGRSWAKQVCAIAESAATDVTARRTKALQDATR